jgi:hypothetical protein
VAGQFSRANAICGEKKPTLTRARISQAAARLDRLSSINYLSRRLVTSEPWRRWKHCEGGSTTTLLNDFFKLRPEHIHTSIVVKIATEQYSAVLLSVVSLATP